MVANNVMTFSLGPLEASDKVLKLKNRLNKSVEQGGILSPFLFNIFDTIIMAEFEKRCIAEGIEAIILGYADDHVICVKKLDDVQRALCLFSSVCREFGMILEKTKTEFVVPANKLGSIQPLIIENGGKESTKICPKSQVKWLGFSLEYSKHSVLILRLGPLAKLFSYVSELAPNVDLETFRTIYRTYVQSSLNYFYIASKYLGGDSMSSLEFWENKLRMLRNLGTMPTTAVICKSQLEILEQSYPRTGYELR